MIRLDKVLFSSLHEAYKNYDTISASVSTGGPVPIGTYQEFTTTVSLSRTGTRADIYYQIEDESTSFAGKILLNASSRILGGLPGDPDSIAFPIIRYAGSNLTLGVSIVNNLFVFNAIYIYDFTIVEYDAPISAL